ncbi:MAG: TauD/TfdA family dioxygenase [Oleiphilaceae bacterium]|nr:TauD/TfdA family dioxygenase [Oleiphilaceae bacterium]
MSHAIPKIEDATAWTPAQLESDHSWRYYFSSSDLNEIERALTHCKASINDLNDINRSNFVLADLATTLEDVADYLESGRGIKILKGLPIARYSREDLRIIYIGLGCYLGTPLRQSTQGEIIQDVYDRGENLYADSGRGTNSSNRLPWHTDRCDIVSLLCLSKAASGGESKLASLTNLYNLIHEERPDLADVLCQPFYHGRAPFEKDDAAPWYQLPVFTQHEGKFASRYLRRFIEIAQDYDDVPRFTPLQVEALDYLDARVEQEDVCLYLPFDIGDIQLLNNFTVCHSRNAYRDTPQQQRFLFRLWLAAHKGRDLDPLFASLYGSTRGGTTRGGILY